MTPTVPAPATIADRRHLGGRVGLDMRTQVAQIIDVEGSASAYRDGRGPERSHRDEARRPQRQAVLRRYTDPASFRFRPKPVRSSKDWMDSGDYDRAVAELVGDDPEMRTQ